MLDKYYYEREKTCRTCANTGSQLSSLFAKEDAMDGICLSDMIRECTMYTIQEDDKLPQHICTVCKEKVQSAYDFKRQCEESHRKLLSMIQSMATNTAVKSGEEDILADDVPNACSNLRKKSARICAAKKHSCPKCDQVFAKAEQLKIHVKTDHSTIRFKCVKCSRGFTSEGYFKRHMNKFHQKLDPVVEESHEKASVKSENVVTEPEISLCDLKKKDNESEDMDFDFGTENDDTPCDLDDTQSVNSVKEESTPPEDNSTEAKAPGETLSDSTEKEDKFEAIEKVEAKLTNKENEVTPKPVTTSKRSSFTVPLNGERSFQCDQCEKSFKRKSHLKQHSLCHTKIKPFECNICQKRFGRHDNLKVHMSNHGQKHFQCNTCDRAFGQAYLLKRHKDQTHSEDKPFLCSECGQRFVRNGDLAIHMRRHSGEKPFKCQYCNKGFTRSTEVYVHERYHTGEKKHVCNVCCKAFQRPYNLLVHVRTHTGERPYQCPHCPKNFTQCSDLKAHIRRHTGERYRCDLCGRGFIHVFVLNQHKLTVHGIEVQSRIKRVAKLPDANTQ